MPEFRFTTADGATKQYNDAIFPIVKVIDGQWIPVGTGFFITTNGVFLTAWHVLESALDSKGRMNCDGIAAFHFLPNDQYLIRPIWRSCHHTASDLAIGVLAEARNNQTGNILKNNVMALTTEPQKVGDDIVTWAYPQTKFGVEGGFQAIRFTPNFYSGIIEEHYPFKRDQHLMPFPCYRGNMTVLGGASGGPVVNLRSGRVFGVNCTGINGENDPVSHYASLSVIRDLWVDNVTIGNEVHERVMIEDLIEAGHIFCD